MTSRACRRRKNVDPIQLYFSILSLSYVHVSNRHTLSITFQQDLSNPKWLAQRMTPSF